MLAELKALGENLFLTLVASDGAQHSSACDWIIPGLCLHVHILCLSLVRTLVIVFRANRDNSEWSYLEILNLTHPQRHFSQIRSYSQAPGIRTWAHLLGGHHSTHYSIGCSASGIARRPVQGVLGPSLWKALSHMALSTDSVQPVALNICCCWLTLLRPQGILYIFGPVFSKQKVTNHTRRCKTL